MTHAHRTSLCAATAICAALALGSTSAWAQEVAPTASAPQVTLPPPAEPSPTIQLPTTAPAPAAPAPAMVSEPVVQQAPAQPAAAPDTNAARSAPRAGAARNIPQRTASPRAAAAEIAPAVAPAIAAPAGAAPAAPVAPAPVAVAPQRAAPAAPTSAAARADGDGGISETAILGLLAALGLAGAGIALLGARRRRNEDEAVQGAPATYVPATAAAADPLGMAAVPPLPSYTSVRDVEGAPIILREEEPVQPASREATGTEEVRPATDHRAAPGSVVGPVPKSRDERDALLDQMVSAAPDAENPFTSRKARLRRARIILQSREIDRKREDTKPFDWRTYKSVASNPASATPPRVTA